ncbi:nose resistant to fluoxetine protein 6 isoform X2 [Bemisia tabaci]|uniref:nose resistant to fluoxetine protein 6 isoform X2 n=1 Tax=Bemisia tabaci TaxID=7038 RepID=UPI003B28BB35
MLWCLRVSVGAFLFCSCFEQRPCATIGDAFYSLDPLLELYTPLNTENTHCSDQTIYFRNAAKKRTPWALQMLDASSKVPSSLLAGNVVDLGNFDQCLAVRSDASDAHLHVVGKYCLIKAIFNQTWSENQEVSLRDLSEAWTWSVCIPAACSGEDLTHHLKLSLNGIAQQVHEVHCTSGTDNVGSSATSLLMICFILTSAFSVFVATWIEWKSIKIPHQLTKSVVASFSLRTNGKILLNNSPPGRMIDSLQGIRVISTLTILAFHRAIYFVIVPSINHADVPRKLTHNVLELLVLNGTLAVDVFFFMGGTVLAYGFIKERKAQLPFSFFKHVMYRYLRITPAYLFVILVYIMIFYDLGSGPIWDLFVGPQRQNCLDNWWTNMLYINNYWNNSEFKSCLGYTWYLGADMQFYVVAPLFLFALLKYRKCGIFLIVITCFASSAYSFWVTYIKDYPWTFTIDYSVLKRSRFQMELYFPAHARLPPFLIGLLFGYLLDHYRKEKMKMHLFQAVASDVIILLPCAAAVSLILEHPFIHLNKLIFKKRSGKVAQSEHPVNTTKSAWVITPELDQASTHTNISTTTLVSSAWTLS